MELNHSKTIGSLQKEIKEDIEPMISVLKSIAKTDYTEIIKADRRKKIIRLLSEKIKKLLKMKVTLEEFMNDKPFPIEPFSQPETKNLLGMVKSGNFEGIQKLLQKCKYYVYEFDQVV